MVTTERHTVMELNKALKVSFKIELFKLLESLQPYYGDLFSSFLIVKFENKSEILNHHVDI